MMARVACLVFACTACEVRSIDLAGRQCPCVTGYVCDPASNTCVTSDAGATDSCLVDPIGAPLYTTAFSDFAGWMPGGDGSWTTQDGMAEQTDTASLFAYAFQSSITANDYRVVSTFRVTGGSGDATSAELSARTQASGGQYHCDWDPINGTFSLMYSSSATDNGFLQEAFIDLSQLAGYDATAWFTMELQVQGSRLDCCVRGIAGAAGFADDTRFATGPSGMKTYMVSTRSTRPVLALP